MTTAVAGAAAVPAAAAVGPVAAAGRRAALVPLVACGFPLAGLGFAHALTVRPYAHEWYWASVGLALAATAGCYVAAGDRRRAGAVLAVVLVAVLSLPKFLRAPHYFAFFDEQAHVRATDALLSGAGLFSDNPLNRVVADYPALHAATATLVGATGGSVFLTGNLLILLLRLAAGAAVFLLAERLVGPGRPAVGLLAVGVFAANPAFAFFDAQFAYESMAAPLVAVVLLLAVRMSTVDERVGPGEVAVGVLLAILVVVTHHGSSYVLSVLLTVLVLGLLAARRRPPGPLLVLAAATVAATAGWLFAAAGYTITYVGPLIGSNLTSVPELLRGTSGPRRLFGGYLPAPAYEQTAGFAAVVALFALYCAGCAYVRKRWRSTGVLLPVLLGAVYFGSLPLVALRVDQVAKRLWEFAFIGLGPVCAVGLAALLRRRPHAVTGGLAALTLAVVFVGGGVARSGEHIRFPGPYLPSADPRSMTPDVVGAAQWLRDRYGPRHRIVGDRTLAVTFGSHGGQDPVTYEEDGVPVWTIVAADEVTPEVLAGIRKARVGWIAVDLRTATRFPLTGYYFNPSEPGAFVDTRLSVNALTKFDHGPFRRVYDGGNVVLYRVAT